MVIFHSYVSLPEGMHIETLDIFAKHIDLSLFVADIRIY